MFTRLGFLGRLSVIILTLLLAFFTLAAVLSFGGRDRQTQTAERFPVPARAAAIVRLLERTPTAERQLILKAISTDRFVVALRPDAPESTSGGIRMPGAEWLVGQYLEDMPGRSVRVFRAEPATQRPLARLLDRLNGASQTPISVAIALSDGTFAIFTLKGDGTRRLFGTPIGFWIGLFGFLSAALALWAVAREARPLRELADSVEQFANDSKPRIVTLRGAPEIRRLVEASNAMQARIAALIKGRTMLLGAISHDVKTYATRLRLRAEMIEAPEQRERANRDLDEMSELIDDALAVARGAVVSDRREVVDLSDLLRNEISLRSEEVPALTFSTASLHCPVEGDRVALRRLFANLLDNAQRYAGRCQVSVAHVCDHIETVIEDDGPGIPETEWEAVFEPFYRVERSRSRATGGSGLGLAIAKQITEAHGGDIRIGTSPLGGARFTIRLPAAPT